LAWSYLVGQSARNFVLITNMIAEGRI